MMPNPFEQFDQGDKNPFAKFDAKPENQRQVGDFPVDVKKLERIGEKEPEPPPDETWAEGVARGIKAPFKTPLGMSDETYEKVVPLRGLDPIAEPLVKGGAVGLDAVRRAIESTSGGLAAGVAGAVPDAVHSAMGMDPKAGREKLERDVNLGEEIAMLLSGASPAGAIKGGAETLGKAGAGAGKAAEAIAGAPGTAARAMLKPTPAAQMLINEGVELPIGAMKGGLLKAAEEKSTSIPITGDAIRSAYNRTIDSWNRATVNQIFKPFGKAVDKNVKPGPDLIRDANKKMDEIYDKIHSQIEFGADDAFAKEAHNILETNLGRVAEGDQPRLRSVLKERVLDELYDAKKVEAPAQYDVYGMKTADAKSETVYAPKELSGKDLQRIRSEIRTEARSFSRSQSMSERQIGYALQDMNAAIGEALGRRNPTAKAALDAADKAYAGLTRIEEASAARVKGGGRFNPTDFLSSIRKMESGPRNKTFANGDALLQEWAGTSQDALASVVNNSGTADRALWYDLLAGGTAYGLGGIPGMAALGATAIPWTGPVVRGMNSLVRQSPAAEIAKSAIKP